MASSTLARSSISLSVAAIRGSTTWSRRASIEDDLGIKKLQIKALDGNEIEIRAGADGFDALGGLGFTPARLFGEPADENDVESATVSAFALGIIEGLNVLDKTKAADADTIIDNALAKFARPSASSPKARSPSSRIPAQPRRSSEADCRAPERAHTHSGVQHADVFQKLQPLQSRHLGPTTPPARWCREGDQPRHKFLARLIRAGYNSAIGPPGADIENSRPGRLI